MLQAAGMITDDSRLSQPYPTPNEAKLEHHLNEAKIASRDRC